MDETARLRRILEAEERARPGGSLPVGPATRRAMAGPEIPHNEAGVPIPGDTPPMCERCGARREESTVWVRETATGAGGYMLKPCRCAGPRA